MPRRAPAPADSLSAVPDACACGRLRRATRALTQMYDDAMAAAGLRVTQYSLLLRLEREGPRRIKVLAAAALIDRTALARNLDPLVERGLVVVRPGRDARTREAAITPAGRAALRAALPHWRRAQAAVSAHLGREDFDALIGTLARLEALHPQPPARQAGEAG